LSVKTRLGNDLLCIQRDVKIYSLTRDKLLLWLCIQLLSSAVQANSRLSVDTGMSVDSIEFTPVMMHWSFTAGKYTTNIPESY